VVADPGQLDPAQGVIVEITRVDSGAVGPHDDCSTPRGVIVGITCDDLFQEAVVGLCCSPPCGVIVGITACS
jgi:hypothetical protein